MGQQAEIYFADFTKNTISDNIYVHVINSPLVAKNTSMRINGQVINSAEIKVEEVVLLDKLPQKKKIEYKLADIKKDYSMIKRFLPDIKDIFNGVANIQKLYELRDIVNKTINLKKVDKLILEVIENLSSDNGKTFELKDMDKKKMLANEHTKNLIEGIKSKFDPDNEWDIEYCLLVAIEIRWLFIKYKSERNFFYYALKYASYEQSKSLIMERLQTFSFSDGKVEANSRDGNLSVEFKNANLMSNGERDVLSFIANLTKFEIEFVKPIGILVIDEVFDYLDGGNMLAAQYYVSMLIESCRNNNKILYPIIFTHLDPEQFANYNFRKRKTHYLTSSGKFDLNSEAYTVLNLRAIGSEKTASEAEKAVSDKIEKYFLHYNPEGCDKDEIGINFDNATFKNILYKEVGDKYLSDLSDVKYDALKVVLGIRIMIEEIVYNRLPPEHREGYLSTHKVINKLNYAEELGVVIPELYYLLNPIYNDPLHFKANNRDEVIKKFKAAYLKLYNYHVKHMIKMIWHDLRLQNEKNRYC